MVFLDSVPSVHELGDLIGTTTTILYKMLIPGYFTKFQAPRRQMSFTNY